MERGKGIPKEWESNRRREVCEWEGCRRVIDVKVHTYGCGLVEDVLDLRFELGVESSAAETELVLVVLHMLNS